MISITRWSLFLIVGLPVQMIVYIVYPFVHLYWLVKIYQRVDFKKGPTHMEMPDEPIRKRMNGWLLDNHDNHGAFTMYGVINELGLSMLTALGNFIRRYDDHGSYNMEKVSGDVVVAWCFAATHKNISIKNLEWTIRLSAWNYLKHLGSCSYDKLNNGWVSNRCNNFGINYCPDSDSFGLGQPMAGPQFYTSSCLFALASKFSFKWKLVFWLHWIIMGGWFWMWSPSLYTKTRPLYYVRDITMKALWVHKYVFGDRFWIRWPMEFINKTCPYRNDLFEAMLGNSSTLLFLPDCMNAFFSQKEDASSRYEENEMNPVLGKEILNLSFQAKKISEGE